MRKIKADITDHILLGILVFILILCADAIVDAAKANAIYELERQTKVQGWTPREIPKCDKELWLRIKDGCK